MEIKELLLRIESEIAKTPTSDLRNLLCDANIVIRSLDNRINTILPLLRAIQNVVIPD